MHRRRFLEVASRWSAGVGVAAPFVGAGLAEPFLAQALPSSSAKGGASTLSLLLDGQDWLIATDPQNIGREQKWFQSPQSGAKKTRVPGIIQEAFPHYHGVAWYWLQFNPHKHPYAGGRYLLRFNAADYLADVWLNGVRLGSHEGGESPFTLDATDAIRPDQANWLAVRVLNPVDEPIDGFILAETPHRNKFVKYGNGSLPDFGGLFESVELLYASAVRVSDAFPRPDWKTGRVPLTITLQNSLKKPATAHLTLTVTSATFRQAVLTDVVDLQVPPGAKEVAHEFTIRNHRLWDIEDPNYYRLSVQVDVKEAEGLHEFSTSFGFRDFRLVNGYFRLNGRRIFVKSTHTGNHSPLGMVVPPSNYPDLLRKDMLNAKACGYNMVRFISGPAHPYQFDLCNELGLMVYEEATASWVLKDSPKMKERYESSVSEMFLRDRNHPSLVMWGMLNETEDGAVHREAVAALPLVRKLDDTRLILLSSGRFDGDLAIGSASNPGGTEWEYVWGKERPGGPKVPTKYPSNIDAGDFHLYPRVPQPPEVDQMMRTLGEGGKPVFLSEYGIGSMMDVIHEARMYEQAGISPQAEDYEQVRSMADKLIADWARLGMEAAYPFPENLLHASQAAMARHRLHGFNLIRSNPKICGFNLTGMLDHALTGEGIWRFWRDWKPGAFDALCDGWAPVRWCLFVEPTHVYAGRPFRVEAVLANEDRVQPGDYRAQFRLWGPNGIAWQKDAGIAIPNPPSGQDAPFAIPVLKEQVTLQGPEGAYELVPYIEQGIAPPETSWQFHVSDPANFPRLTQKITSWGLPREVESWLTARGATVAPWQNAASGARELILVGNVSTTAKAGDWKALAARIASGSTVVFLSPQAFQREKDSTAWLPLAKKGRVYEFNDWLYHKECVAKPHPIFAGLQGKGILDWYYYGPMIPHFLFDGQDTPAEVVAAAFAAGYSTPGGYASGILLGAYSWGAGKFILNTFPILDHLDKHPVADRMLLNLVAYAATGGAAAALPGNFAAQLKEIGYE